jgi:hypothetical protein
MQATLLKNNTESTLNIPVKLHHDTETGFTYCDRFSASLYAPSLNTAKARLRPEIERQIDEMVLRERNYRRKVIGCVSGEVLIVYFSHGSWGYDIAGDGRTGCCSCCGLESFEVACEKARDHADQVWGGVKWEC